MFNNKACAVFTVLTILSKSQAKQVARQDRGRNTNMEGFIVGGEYASIEDFPHAAFLSITCVSDDVTEKFSCGSSILNQVILLTAGHCVANCLPGSKILVSVGSSIKNSKHIYQVAAFVNHPLYDEEEFRNDIALAALTVPLIYSKAVSRVVLPQVGIYDEMAVLAGWGITDEGDYTETMHLKNTHQTVLTREECLSTIPTLEQGVVCSTGSYNEVGDFSYPSLGDSGSALMVRNYIQIGIVSHRIPEISQSFIMYTDVAYFYDWISETSKDLFCTVSDY